MTETLIKNYFSFPFSLIKLNTIYFRNLFTIDTLKSSIDKIVMVTQNS